MFIWWACTVATELQLKSNIKGADQSEIYFSPCTPLVAFEYIKLKIFRTNTKAWRIANRDVPKSNSGILIYFREIFIVKKSREQIWKKMYIRYFKISLKILARTWFNEKKNYIFLFFVQFHENVTKYWFHLLYSNMDLGIPDKAYLVKIYIFSLIDIQYA